MNTQQKLQELIFLAHRKNEEVVDYALAGDTEAQQVAQAQSEAFKECIHLLANRDKIISEMMDWADQRAMKAEDFIN